MVGAPTDCDEIEPAVFDNADQQSKRTGDALVLSEYGATDDTAVLRAHRQARRPSHGLLAGVALLRVQRPDDQRARRRPGSGQGSGSPPRGANVFRNKLKALARPYPQAIAGTPLRFSFQPTTRRFKLVYETKRANGHGRFRRGLTDVFVPKIQYPRGYRARVRGGSLSRASTSRHLIVHAKPGAKRIAVRVAPR